MLKATPIVPREVQTNEARGAPIIYNKILRKKNVRLEM
jgi:hypothetical protein